MKIKTVILPLFATVLFAVSPPAFAGKIPLLYPCNDDDREHNKDIYSRYGDNSSHRVLISMAKCSDSENERRRLLQIVADRGVPAGKYLLAQLDYTENWEVKRTNDLERLKKSYDLFMETLESIQDQPDYPLVSEIGDKKLFNDSYYEMLFGILPYSCISKGFALYEIKLQVPVETNSDGTYIFDNPIYQINRYKNLQKQICGSLDEDNQPLETAISYRAKFKKNLLEKRENEISGLDERHENDFNKLDHKEVKDFFRDLPYLVSNATDNTDIQSKSEYAAAAFAAMSENEQAEFCISIRSPQRPCFCTTGIVCTKNYCIDRPNCVEPEDVDYGHLLNDYTPSEKSAEESAAEEPTNESATDESVAEEPTEEPAAEESPAEEPAEEIAEEPAEPETKTVCRSFANGINPDNTQWGRIGASEAGVGETEYAAIRAAIKICENDGLTECQTDLEVECEEVAAE